MSWRVSWAVRAQDGAWHCPAQLGSVPVRCEGCLACAVGVVGWP